jgi:hypothetical protein
MKCICSCVVMIVTFLFFCLHLLSLLLLLQIETEAKPITNQKNSGRCWIFATLNVIRIPFMKEHNLDEFEFSQAHLFFWDKVRHDPSFICGNLTPHYNFLNCEEIFCFSLFFFFFFFFFRLNAATISLPTW